MNLTWVNQTTKTLAVQNGTLSGTITYTCNGTGVAGVTVNLTKDRAVIASTTTNSNGNYILTNLSTGDYNLTASKIRFWSNSTSVTIIAGDCAMLKDASTGKIVLV